MSTEMLPTGSAYSLQPGARMSMGMQRQLGRAVERVHAQAVVAKLTEDGRAALTNLALENVGALTTLEQHLITIAPLGEARYREIVDSYTLGASAAIRRWGSC
ncbi:hypothetical protein GCM10027414_04910 [Humibacter ginsengiterrae]